jgi:hypothetical protein
MTLKPTRALVTTELMRAGARQVSNPGFKGSNFITNEIVGYYKLRSGRLVEISMGEFMKDTVIGYTVLNRTGESRAMFELDDLAKELAR